jgi:diguanylate cyclase (GGDEF)-like protein/PAS domain S-box-containing protein
VRSGLYGLEFVTLFEKNFIMSVMESYAEKLKYIFDNAKVGIAICNAEDNRLEIVNPAFAAIHGYEPHELIGMSPGEVFAPECMLRLSEHESAPSCAINDVAFETTHTRKDGSPVHVSVHITVIKDENGIVKQRIANIQDITEKIKEEAQLRISQEQLSETQIRLSALISTIPDLIWMKDEEGVYLSCNIAYQEFIGLKESELIGKTDYDFYNRESADVCRQSDIEAINAGGISISEEAVTYQKNNSIGVMEIRKAPIFNPDGKLMGVLGIARDITERKLVEQQIEFMAHHDALTELPNRILAKDRMKQSIAYAKRHKTKAALIFIDLDGFKTINDSLGHSVGDVMLKGVTSRLKECLRESDTLSRQGGDEFLIILQDINDLADVAALADKLIQAFEQPFSINNQHLCASASIGIALYPGHGDSFESLLQNADAAMYKAKESGKNTYRFFTAQMNHNILGQFQIQSDLRHGIKNSEFILHYQPQIDLANNAIIGVEALIRWKHPYMGMIPPMNFIHIAEESGLIVPIGQWVIEEACRQAAAWHGQGIQISVAVNISAVQFKRGNLEAVVKNALEHSGLNPKYLELELTESIMMYNVESTLQTVQALKALGVGLSIDDFGTGYSSLAYLKRFAVDKVKIDQSFIRDILTDKEDAVIVQTIIQMAKNLNLKSIAEGVENESVLSIINGYGCDEVQGYHFAKPMEALDFEQYYEDFNRKLIGHK